MPINSIKPKLNTNILLTKMGNRIRQISDYGLQQSMLGGFPSGFRVIPNKKASLKYLPVGLFYQAKNGLSDFLLPRREAYAVLAEHPMFKAEKRNNALLDLNYASYLAIPQMLSQSTNGNKEKEFVNEQILTAIILALHPDFTFFTEEDITWILEDKKYNAPLEDVKSILDNMVGEEPKLLAKVGESYCLNATYKKIGDYQETFKIAKNRRDNEFSTFISEIEDRMEKLEAADNLEDVWNIVNEGRRMLGFRGMYFYRYKNGLLNLARSNSRRENIYLKAESPYGIFQQFLMERKDILCKIDEIGDDLQSAKEAFVKAGFNITEKDTGWIETSILRHKIRSLVIAKLVDESGNPVEVVVLRNPVISFWKKNEWMVKTSLIRLVCEMGKAIGRITKREDYLNAERKKHTRVFPPIKRGALKDYTNTFGTPSQLPEGQISFRLTDEKNHYVGSIVSEGEKREEARELVASTLEKSVGYSGFSNDIDKKYDPYSVCFVIEGKNKEIIATARITHKVRGISIPIEDGIKEDGGHYTFDEEYESTAEVNSFYFKTPATLPLLFSMMSLYAFKAGIRKGFCLSDASNKKLENIYQEAGFNPSKRFNQTIHFPTFGKIMEEELKPTQWKIMELSEAFIVWRATSAKENYTVEELSSDAKPE